MSIKEQEFFSNELADLDSIFQELKENIPEKSKIDVKTEKTRTKKIAKHNQAIIETYLNGEISHLQQQKPIAIIIALATLLQLIAFNVLIYLIILKFNDKATLSILLDFMKYYTGAVIIEMLGMCLIIVKGVYSISLNKMVEHILKSKN